MTAWETLFDKLRLGPDITGRLLVVSAAGGVGSMVIQLARALTGLEVIATASREESAQWATRMGAHHIADHHALVESVRKAVPDVQYVFSPVSGTNVEAYAELLTPRGEIVAIDEPPGMDLLPLKDKSLTWHWELMLTRPLFEPESTVHREILNEVARLVDAGADPHDAHHHVGPALRCEPARGAPDDRVGTDDREGRPARVGLARRRVRPVARGVVAAIELLAHRPAPPLGLITSLAVRPTQANGSPASGALDRQGRQ